MSGESATFDQILPILEEEFQRFAAEVTHLKPLLINRDLNGRVSLVVEERPENEDPAGQDRAAPLTESLAERLGPHAFPSETFVRYESTIADASWRARPFRLFPEDPGILVVDRTLEESEWGHIEAASDCPRIVFYSIKGGVGRSTAVAVTAWHLAEQGHRVLVMDLDLESPGLSSTLLPQERMPRHGVTDWLVEDLVDNGDALIPHMWGRSPLSDREEVLVVPAHGKDPGEYVAKLGRVWMPRGGSPRQPWPRRLHRLLTKLEAEHQPDVILLDARSGIDETASGVVTDLGAHTILLFGNDHPQTWTGYGALFQHWKRREVVRYIRERLQMVGSLAPDTGREEWFRQVREKAWELFQDHLYDALDPGDQEGWNFDLTDIEAPHTPWTFQRHPVFERMNCFFEHHGPGTEPDLTRAVFKPLLEGIAGLVAESKS